MRNKYVEIAVQTAGSQSALAKIVGHPQSLVSAWLLGKRRVSVDSVPLIVHLTKGRVKAHELRPDLPMIFPHTESNTNAS